MSTPSACMHCMKKTAVKRPRLTFAWFFGVQVLVKSLGGLVFATVGSILIWFFRPKMQLRVAAAVALSPYGDGQPVRASPCALVYSRAVGLRPRSGG